MSQHTRKHLGHSSEAYSCRFPNKLLLVLSVNSSASWGGGGDVVGDVIRATGRHLLRCGLWGEKESWRVHNCEISPNGQGVARLLRIAGWRKHG